MAEFHRPSPLRTDTGISVRDLAIDAETPRDIEPSIMIRGVLPPPAVDCIPPHHAHPHRRLRQQLVSTRAQRTPGVVHLDGRTFGLLTPNTRALAAVYKAQTPLACSVSLRDVISGSDVAPALRFSFEEATPSAARRFQQSGDPSFDTPRSKERRELLRSHPLSTQQRTERVTAFSSSHCEGRIVFLGSRANDRFW